jgi:hypothetical protein
MPIAAGTTNEDIQNDPRSKRTIAMNMPITPTGVKPRSLRQAAIDYAANWIGKSFRSSRA